MLSGSAKPRINGQLMGNYQGKVVCLLGAITEVDSSGMSFKLKTPDDTMVAVHLQEPHQECLTGIIEVQGKVTSKNTLLCNNYVLFPPEHTETFDLSLYNEVVLRMNKANLAA